MKFIVNEMPKFGFDCPFFSRGRCYCQTTPDSTSNYECRVFNELGYKSMYSTYEECLCLMEQKVHEATWIPKENSIKVIEFYTCSYCNNIEYSNNINFCPHCGAKMKKEN